ncbi:MAG: hypothetical protein FD170_3365 [Bacteroidetes bacterium]|nr:MAG: hypothetical protein FD170_3365 [Bacteroidota bacterium]
MQPCKIAVLITTHQRAGMLLDLLAQLSEQSREYTIYPIIAIDGPQPGYDVVLKYLETGFQHHSLLVNAENGGKARYWELINLIFAEAQRMNEIYSFDYFIQLPDDISIAPDFFNEAIHQFRAIADPRVICLNLLNDGRTQTGWTRIQPKDVSYSRYGFIRTGWVDMCYISTSRFFEQLHYKIKPVNLNWSADPARSSGVGMQISKRLTAQGYNMYMVFYSLVDHGTHTSQMHPQHRKEVPLVAKIKQPRDKVTAGMATIPGREKSLRDAVNSIINQVDELIITLNGHQSIPDCLKHEKIKVISDPGNSRGDAAKFAILGAQGYLFTLDDDLIYPSDYIAVMIAKIDFYSRKALICHHGRFFHNFPVKSYYHSPARIVRCTDQNHKDQVLHIPGTGVSGWHSSTLPHLAINHFYIPNMSDIWMGIYCKINQVQVIGCEHKKYWIQENSAYDRKGAIYARYNRNDAFQTLSINSIEWMQ